MGDDGTGGREVRGDGVVGDVAGGEVDGRVVGWVEEVEGAVKGIDDLGGRVEGIGREDGESST